ncbi:hypothetical protein AVEN_124114-1 [Araneus ventricosus]|uniref:Uncharacterized protein n=1 Tax=Araneus ventricosus TaxID=182803 RepID=A0A4Y2H2J0_ARAVE|nr:hypothetical protein AVEN_124114-1 [Araneus ventricosus]
MGRIGRGPRKNLPSSYYHSQGNRPDVLGTPDPELVNQWHAMSKHSRARSHHSLYVTDPHWATPSRPHWANENTALPGSQKRHLRPLRGQLKKNFNRYGLPYIQHCNQPISTTSEKTATFALETITP